MTRLPIAILLCAALCACGDPGPTPLPQTSPRAPATAPGKAEGAVAPVTGTATLAKIKFKAADPARSFSIKVREDGAKLVDGAENELARIRIEPDGRIKVKDAADKPLATVTGAAPQWHLKDAESGQVLFQLVRQDDGDLKLEDGAGRLLYRIKKRDYGAEVETPDDQSLFKSKLKSGGLSIRDAADQTVLSSNDATDPQAAALLVVTDLTLPQRAGLWYVLEHPTKAAEPK